MICTDLSGLARPPRAGRHGQELTIDEFVADSRRFRIISPHPSKRTRHSDLPEITVLGTGKFNAHGSLNEAIYRRGTEGWHTDGAYDEVPFKAAQLYALAISDTGKFGQIASVGEPLLRDDTDLDADLCEIPLHHSILAWLASSVTMVKARGGDYVRKFALRGPHFGQTRAVFRFSGAG